MVTFSLPGDDDVEPVASYTPKQRPSLPFSKRPFTSSPLASASPRRNDTPQTAPSRKFMLGARDARPPSGLSNSSIAAARSIFRESAFEDGPPSTAFSPSLPAASAMKKVFAPGATPEPTRTFRQSTSQATPRAMTPKAVDKELFPMRISSPPPELSGEALTQKIPREWNSKGSIYADQFLAHLCPPGLDEEQRRQFFCILDLRRLKYAANDIFSRKDWKLNVINFAKEFEKSRSIILLRYGLYEFQNVKPSKDVLKRWRREHGLPEPEEDDTGPSPSKMASSKKRKANDVAAPNSSAAGNLAGTPQPKRRATVEDQDLEATPAPTPAPMHVSTPAPSPNKRKAEDGDEHRAKIQKSAPSAAKTLFERIANKSTSAAAQSAQTSNNIAKPNPVVNKTSSSSALARSVFSNPASLSGPTPGSNIFGYLSDASSAKNSGVEDDAESESEDAPEETSGGEGASDEPSMGASGAGELGSHVGSSLFAKQPASLSSGSGQGLFSNPETRESTPGRSLFERVAKDGQGQPIRSEKPDDAEEKTTAPRDQTWNPSTTPIKFAPSNADGAKPSLFAPSAGASASSVFGQKSTPPSFSFGAADDKAGTSAKPASANLNASQEDKNGCESDKENESQPSKKSPFELKTTAQPSLGSSLFQPKPASTSSSQAAEASRPGTSLFGSAMKNTSKPDAAPATSNLFGNLSKADGSGPATSQPSSLFGVKTPTESSAAAKAGSLFGGPSTTPPTSGAPGTTTSLFGAKKPEVDAADGPGSGASTPPLSLFGGSLAQTDGPAPTNKDDAAPKNLFVGASSAAFGMTGSAAPTGSAPKAFFGAAPKSPPQGGAEKRASDLFDGSPMKQDEPSPAKGTATNGDAQPSAPAFSFGSASGMQQKASQATAPTTSAPSGTSIFSGVSAPASGTSSGSNLFGTASAPKPGAGGFNFNFGDKATGSSFNNPFATTLLAAPPGSNGGSGFSFGGTPSSGSASASTSFQFGAGGGGTSGSAGGTGGSLFGATQPAGSFGGASTAAPAPMFSFSGNPSQVGSDQAVPALGGPQPAAGGSSTTGTNSPLNFGGGGSSLATTPAAGTPEPGSQGDGAIGGGGGGGGDDNEGGEKQTQINLTDGAEHDEEIVHEVRAKALKFVPPAEGDEREKGKSKSPWTTQGVGPLRLLRHHSTGLVRLVLRAEPRGNVALNRALLPTMSYKADEKYVKITTSNDDGNGLETWMVQVKTKELARELAEALEKNKHGRD